MTDPAEASERERLPPFSLVAGGPFHQLERAFHLSRGEDRDILRLSLATVGITWLPLALLSLAEWLVTGRPSRLLTDLAIEARFLVTIPLLFVAERALHVRTRRCIDQFRKVGVEGPDEITRLTAATMRVRDALLPEIVLFALAVTGGLAEASGLTGRTGLFVGYAETLPHSVARTWYGLVAFPVFLFLQGRALWWWLLWCHLLLRLSRLRVRPVASHPDRRGGLAFLSEPAIGFAPVLTGAATVGAGGFANLMLAHGLSASTFLPSGVLFLAAALLLTVGPLTLFSGHLQRARFAAIEEYGILALDYTRAFQRRWIGARHEERLLGTPDIQSLADLANSYDIVREMRIVPVEVRAIAVIAAAAFAPMGLLFLIEMPLPELARRLVIVFFKGIAE